MLCDKCLDNPCCCRFHFPINRVLKEQEFSNEPPEYEDVSRPWDIVRKFKVLRDG